MVQVFSPPESVKIFIKKTINFFTPSFEIDSPVQQMISIPESSNENRFHYHHPHQNVHHHQLQQKININNNNNNLDNYNNLYNNNLDNLDHIDNSMEIDQVPNLEHQSYQYNNNFQELDNNIMQVEIEKDIKQIEEIFYSSNSSNNNSQPTVPESDELSIDAIDSVIPTMPIYDSQGKQTNMLVIPTDLNFYVYKILSWLVCFDSEYLVESNYSNDPYEFIRSSLASAKSVLAAHEIPMSIFPIVILYADKFVQRCGINHKQLFNLLLISAIVCVKYYGETVRADYQVLGKFFNFTKKQICDMERLFLTGLEFQLFIQNSEVKELLQQIERDKYHFNKYSIDYK